MKATLWGTRGSLAAPGPETVRYGGNTSCVEVRSAGGAVLVLDAGTGIRRLGASFEPGLKRVDILLTHLHMDHVQGLGFFAPLFTPGMEVHIWGPSSATMHLRERLTRYLSPPLFPVLLRDLPCDLQIHDLMRGELAIGPFQVSADLISHPGPTLGFRVSEGGRSLTYMPDHEPALGMKDFPGPARWMSGFDLAAGTDLLIHDTQYIDAEYAVRAGWGHCTITHAFRLAELAGVKHLVGFHHDPSHADEMLDAMAAEALGSRQWPFRYSPGLEGATFTIA
ncbi:MAG: MBL fold metallo-hydrolase [Chloroflexi bacterium]|nr:MBL fold metallo-hydrolase [Chloroflexota bacterium]